VIGLTEPWHGHLNLSGVGFAVAAAFGWAGYIVLTQRVGAQLTGLQGLAMSLGTATDPGDRAAGTRATEVELSGF